MAATKPITIAPLTGTLDLRSTPDLLPSGGCRMRQNFQTVGEGKIRRGVGWSKLLSQANYNNTDFHDQLLVFPTDETEEPFLGPVEDDMESYGAGQELDGLNGGVGWSGAYVDAFSFTGVQALDSMESYSASDPLDGLDGGNGWGGPYVDR